jgi:hypothetical protein
MVLLLISQLKLIFFRTSAEADLVISYQLVQVAWRKQLSHTMVRTETRILPLFRTTGGSDRWREASDITILWWQIDNFRVKKSNEICRPVSNKQACARVLCWATCIALHARAHRMNYEHQLWWCVPAPACYGEIGRREIDRVLFHLQRYTLHVHLLVLASDDNILRVVLGILYQANV